MPSSHETHAQLDSIPYEKPPFVALSYSVVPHVVALTDALFIVLLSIACGLSYHLIGRQDIGDVSGYAGFGIIAAALFSTSAHARGLYQGPRLDQSRFQIRETVLIWSIVCLCLLLVAFAFKVSDLLSRGTVLLFFVAGPCGIAALRLGTPRAIAFLTSRGLLASRQIVIVAESDVVVPRGSSQVVELPGCKIGRIFLVQSGLDDAVFKARMADLIAHVRQRHVDEILLAISWTDARLIERIAADLRNIPLAVKLLPDPVVRTLLARPLCDVGRSKGVELQRAPLNGPQLAAKRCLDVTAILLALPLLVPALAVVVILIALDSPGPVLFRQSRVGFNGRPFQIYKFRTMTTLDNGPVIQQASPSDVRVTRVGRVLRRLSIDELPQVLNVLKGDMSLVGPRPHALAHDNEYTQLIAYYAARHNVKPGITGWAQVNGWRGATPRVEMMQQRVEHDLWYITYWSFWLDVKILTLTLLRVLRAQNAY